VALAERAAARNGRLARQGAGSRQQEEEARSDLLARRAAAEALDERLIATRGTLADTAKRLQRTGIDTQKARSQLLAQRAALAGQADALRRSDSLVVTAPVAGTVADLSAQPGQRVTDRASVATLVPLHAALQVHLFAPSRAVGFAHPGEEVRLRFDAFPYQKYGAVRGAVVAVSPVTVDPASIDPALDLHDPVFRVTVRLDPVRPLPVLRPGMTLSADLMMARRPLWALVFGPIREAARS
jgi:membrane fusion protein